MTLRKEVFSLKFNNIDKKKLFEILIPAMLACMVFIGFAISGHVAKRINGVNPAVVSAEKDNGETKKSKSSKSGSVTLIAAGDNLINDTLIAAGQQENGKEDYSAFYANIKSYISSADIAVINQETVLGGTEFEYSGYPSYNTPWAVGESAIDAGFDVFTCATEHSMDMGFAGIQQQSRFFEEHPKIVHTGTYASEEASNSIAYFEKNHITFALLNYTFGTNGVSVPDDKKWCVSVMDKKKITEDVKSAQAQADVIIAFPHWGTEYSTAVSTYQQEYVSLFSDLGVDIVIGSHPHVLQRVEWVENKKTEKKTLVYYSLGNFVSYQTTIDQLCGGLAEIKIDKTKNGIEISSAKLVPVVCWFSETDGEQDFSVYKLSDYMNQIAKTHQLRDMGATPEYFSKLVKDTVSEEFL